MNPKITIIIPVYNEEQLLLRALESVPKNTDTQLILLDDGSTDASWDIIKRWWRENGDYFNSCSTIHRWDQNKGVAATMNLGFNLARGDYVGSLSSDDYYLTDFEQLRPYMDDKNDLIFFDLRVNDGDIWHLDEESKSKYVGAVKFIRREFLGKTRNPNKKWHEDIEFSRKLQAKEPREVFTGVVLKHYNWPHEGSLTWQANHKK